MSAVARVVGSVGVAALLALGVCAPAHAAGELELSLDGVSWSADLVDEIFGHVGVIVPGDVIRSDLWVRNASSDRAQIELDVADALGAVPGTFAGDLALTIDGTPTAGGARWRGPDLAPGAALRIPLVLEFDPASTTSSRSGVTTVLDAVVLVQTAAGPGREPAAQSPVPGAAASPVRPAASGSAPRSGNLARTGSELTGVLGVAFAAVGGGFLLVVARRRSRRVED